MAAFHDLPIRRKLVVIGAAASVLALAVSSFVFLLSTYVALRANLRSELETQAGIIADNTAAAVAFLDESAAAETIGALRSTSRVNMACVFDAGGKLFAVYMANGFTDACPDAPPPDGEAIGRAIGIVRPITQKDRRVGTLYLHGNFNRVRAGIVAQGLATFVAMGLGIIAAILLANRMQRAISDPVIELSSTAARISQAGDYSLRAARHGNDEVGELVDTFNGMVAEVARRDEELRAANRSKDEFLAALSHELRTPLNAVLGWIQVLRTRAPVDPSLVARAYASIERNARAQTALIEELLDVSRIVTGKLHFSPEAADLTGIVDAAIEAVRPSIDAKRTTLTRDLLPSPQWIHGDPNRLQQVVSNLLANASKFTPAEGHIAVNMRSEGMTYLIDVIDDGAGMSPDFLPHAFDRFRQGDGSITRPHRGLGLGLAIARELVELHGGRITAESPGPGRGSTFTVRLPKDARLGASRVLERDLPVETRTAPAGLFRHDRSEAADVATTQAKDREGDIPGVSEERGFRHLK